MTHLPEDAKGSSYMEVVREIIYLIVPKKAINCGRPVDQEIMYAAVAGMNELHHIWHSYSKISPAIFVY